MPADAPGQMLDHGAHLFALGRLALAQDHRYRLAAFDVIDVDRQEAAAIVMGVPERKLLTAMHLVDSVTDIDRDSLGGGRKTGAELIGERRRQPRRLDFRWHVVVALSIVAASALGLPALGVPTTGAIPAGLPTLEGPALRLRDVEGIVPLAAGCLLLPYIEGISAARTFAAKHGYAVDPRQEFLGMGQQILRLRWVTAIPWPAGCHNRP
jgi:hypothetical protein